MLVPFFLYNPCPNLENIRTGSDYPKVIMIFSMKTSNMPVIPYVDLNQHLKWIKQTSSYCSIRWYRRIKLWISMNTLFWLWKNGACQLPHRSSLVSLKGGEDLPIPIWEQIYLNAIQIYSFYRNQNWSCQRNVSSIDLKWKHNPHTFLYGQFSNSHGT